MVTMSIAACGGCDSRSSRAACAARADRASAPAAAACARVRRPIDEAQIEADRGGAAIGALERDRDSGSSSARARTTAARGRRSATRARRARGSAALGIGHERRGSTPARRTSAARRPACPSRADRVARRQRREVAERLQPPSLEHVEAAAGRPTPPLCRAAASRALARRRRDAVQPGENVLHAQRDRRERAAGFAARQTVQPDPATIAASSAPSASPPRQSRRRRRPRAAHARDLAPDGRGSPSRRSRPDTSSTTHASPAAARAARTRARTGDGHGQIRAFAAHEEQANKVVRPSTIDGRQTTVGSVVDGRQSVVASPEHPRGASSPVSARCGGAFHTPGATPAPSTVRWRRPSCGRRARRRRAAPPWLPSMTRARRNQVVNGNAADGGRGGRRRDRGRRDRTRQPAARG